MEQDDDYIKVVTLYQDNIHPFPNGVEADDLQDMYRDYGAEWVIEAIKEAARQRARSIKYISAILNRWKKTGNLTPWEMKGGGSHGKTGRDFKQDDDDSWAEQFAHLGANDTG